MTPKLNDIIFTMPDINELSERELEILRLVATGASNKEIAQQLFISPNTVKVHLKNIFSKIGVASRTEAAMAAVHIGLVQNIPPADGRAAQGENERLLPGELAEGQDPAAAGLKRPPAWRAAWRAYGLWALLAVVLVFGTAGMLLLSSRLAAMQVLASPSPSMEPPRWQERSPLPSARTGLAVVAFEDRVYAIGGQTAEGVSGRVERYDPEANTWEELASKPVPVADAGAVVIGGLIYVPGGRLASEKLSDVLEVYDPYQDRWETKASMPKALSAFASTAFEGHLYVFGGWDGTKYSDTVYQYDPIQDRWQPRTAMPTARAYAGAAVAGGRIYIIGGYDGRQALAVNEAYQPARDRDGGDPWFKMKPMPVARYGIGIASVADIIHIVGGEGLHSSSFLPSKYFPQLDDWQVMAEEQTQQLKGWSYLQLAPVGTNLYALGGSQNGAPSDQNLVYQAIYTISIPVVR
jgi:DNA-binding CsgD family transcriptional regulator